VRKGQYKLLQFYETGKCELYDLANDVAEQHDLAGEMSEKAQEMQRDLLDYLQSANARLPKRKESASP
jgi:hypothetical protein